MIGAHRNGVVDVSNPYVVAGGGDAWSAEATAAGRRGTQRLLDVRVAEPIDEVRAALDLPTGERVVCRSRLMLLDDAPVEIADSFYPASFAAGSPLASPAKIRGGAVAALAALDRAAAEVAELVTARLPDPYEMDMLAIPAGEPLLLLSRISYDASGRPVEYAVNRMIARRSPPLSYRMRVTGP
jgi:DNA-binding GntR family transcriptional regulator